MCGECVTCGFRLGLDSAFLCAVKTCWNQVLCVLRFPARNEEHGESSEPQWTIHTHTHTIAHTCICVETRAITGVCTHSEDTMKHASHTHSKSMHINICTHGDKKALIRTKNWQWLYKITSFSPFILHIETAIVRRYSVFSKTHQCWPEGLKTAHCALLWQCVILNNHLIIAMSVTCWSLTQPPEQNHSADRESHLEERQQLRKALFDCLYLNIIKYGEVLLESFSPSFPFTLWKEWGLSGLPTFSFFTGSAGRVRRMKNVWWRGRRILPG